MARNHEPVTDASTTIISFLILPLMLVGLWFLLKEDLLAFAFTYSPPLFRFTSNYFHYIYSQEQLFLMAQLKDSLPYMNPKDYGFSALMDLMALWGRLFSIILAPFFAYIIVKCIYSVPKYRYRGQLKLAELSAIHSKRFVSTLPALRANVSTQDGFVGKWRYADDMLSYAWGAGLLRYKDTPIPPMTIKQRRMKAARRAEQLPDSPYCTLDYEKTDALFVNQLGKPWRGIDCLSTPLKALAVALMACGEKELNQEGLDLLDEISLNFFEGEAIDENNCKAECTVDGLYDLQQKIDTRAMHEITRKHEYESTVFIALLVHSRTKGKVPPNRFLWLRPYNRVLWYTLNQIGGERPWAEGMAGWAHYLAEIDYKKPIATPVIQGATESLEFSLIEEGWIVANPDTQDTMIDDDFMKGTLLRD